jgi:hypothetical protein
LNGGGAAVPANFCRCCILNPELRKVGENVRGDVLLGATGFFQGSPLSLLQNLEEFRTDGAGNGGTIT